MYGEVGIEIVCVFCGEDLDVNQTPNRTFNVTPCPNCIKDAKQEGYDEGYSDGEAEADN